MAPRTVAQAVVIPPLLFVLLENFRGGGLRPELPSTFAHVIRSAIPSTVCGPDDMPFGRIAELEKYVVAYLERAALLYAILFEVSRRTGQSMRLDPSVYWCLSQAITFDYFLGKPMYGYVPNARKSFLSRISLAANLANKARGPSSALDVQLTPDFASLSQLINNWACENALLKDGIEQTQNFGRALEKSATYADMGWFLQYEVAYVGLVFFCPKFCCRAARWRPVNGRETGGIRMITASRKKHRRKTVGLIRDAVSVLLKNMVALGKASLKCGSFGDASTARYFVPPEGTMLFGMAEQFVDLYGYHGDTSPFDRALMFDNLNTLFRTMVLDEEYLWFGIDFPNFDVSKEDLERYGIYEFIKPRQIARLSSEEPGTVVHQFGDCSLRYNPKLGNEARYQFPDLSREYAATRPNTPVLSPVTEVADEVIEEEEDSDKENESGGVGCLSTNADPPTPHSSARPACVLDFTIPSPPKRIVTRGQDIGTRWTAFLEFRLRPMVYFVHAAVTHNFTLIGAKGVYSLVELDHIKYWRLLLSSRCAVRLVYMDNVCIRYPPVVGLPGEATATFEIMHRVCRSVGYPFNQESWILNLDLLIPLMESARETRGLLRTVFDYPAFDKHGQLLIPDFYSVEAWPQNVSVERNIRGHPVSTR
ncbi:hypothetical protein B0H14DRAFT_2639383 [Mycena olivaceomarginata]|nr:hypothetical protein B0H14DRAFT_2639383 [Mycena olivaceomarginata]